MSHLMQEIMHQAQAKQALYRELNSICAECVEGDVLSLYGTVKKLTVTFASQLKQREAGDYLEDLVKDLNGAINAVIASRIQKLEEELVEIFRKAVQP